MNQHLKCRLIASLLTVWCSVSLGEELVKAEFTCETQSEKSDRDRGYNKDWDTRLYVAVVLKEEKSTRFLPVIKKYLAAIEGAENSKQPTKDSAGKILDPGTSYLAGTKRTVTLNLMNRHVTEAEAQRCKFKVAIAPVGNDLWRVANASITLYFDNGRSLTRAARLPPGPDSYAFELGGTSSQFIETDFLGD